MTSRPTEREALTDYWRRLGLLTSKEWEGFYRLVRSALMRCPASELAGLPDTRESYIDEFFTEKLFHKAQRVENAAGESLSGGALCGFFRNYLRDILEHYKARPISDADPDEAWFDPSPPPQGNVDEFLADIGIDTLALRIDALLDALPDWALLMLRGHFCADDDAVPMVKLCADIPSYQYKAQKLGVTVKKSSDGLRGYEHTMIGAWMQSLGVAIEPGNMGVMRFLLDALCLEATARVVGEDA